jgi:hypothetical protein
LKWQLPGVGHDVLVSLCPIYLIQERLSKKSF